MVSGAEQEELRVADKYAFLSDEWFDAAGRLVSEHGTGGPPAPNLVMNLEVAAADGATTEFHMGSRDGVTLFGKGHTDGADLTLATDIDTAREVFVANNPAAGMQAFMAGKVRHPGRHDQADDGAGGRSGQQPTAHRSPPGHYRIRPGSVLFEGDREQHPEVADPLSATGSRTRAAASTARASPAGRSRSPVGPSAVGWSPRAVSGASRRSPS